MDGIRLARISACGRGEVDFSGNIRSFMTLLGWKRELKSMSQGGGVVHVDVALLLSACRLCEDEVVSTCGKMVLSCSLLMLPVMSELKSTSELHGDTKGHTVEKPLSSYAP